MRYITFFTVFLLLPLFVGCAEDNPFGVVYVEGTVTYNGDPIEGVSVTFIPLDAGEQLGAGGRTNSRGRFDLTAGGSPAGSGARPGQYDVIFTKQEVARAASPEEEARMRGMGAVTHLIPQRYNNVRTSGIEPVTVTTNRRNNVFNFALTTEP